MNDGLGTKLSGPVSRHYPTVPVFAWRDRERSRKITDKMPVSWQILKRGAFHYRDPRCTGFSWLRTCSSGTLWC